MNKNVIYIAVIIIMAVIIFLQKCSSDNRETELLDNVTSYTDSAKYYKGKYGEIVAYNKTLQFNTKKQLIKYLSKQAWWHLSLKNWKDIDNAVHIKTITEIVNDTIYLTDTIPCDFKPISVRRITDNYRFNGTITKETFVIDSLRIPNEMTLLIGKKKIGFLKYESRIEVNNTNPLIQTTNIGSFKLDTKKKWYETRAASLGVGIIIGILIK